MATDPKKTAEDLNIALDALIAAIDWFDAEQAIARSAYKGDCTKAAIAAHAIFLNSMEKAKPLIEKRRTSRNG